MRTRNVAVWCAVLLATPAWAAPPSPAAQSTIEQVSADLAVVRERLVRLQEAVAGGMDAATLAPSMEVAQGRVLELEAELEVLRAVPITPTAQPSDAPLRVVIVPGPAQPQSPVALGLGVSSTYVFRGLNVLGDGDPEDQHGITTPSMRWDVGDTGVYFSYWGAYQINGANAHKMVRAGLGHEQNAVVGIERAVAGERVFVSTAVTTYVFPFADSASAGTAVPLYLEPVIGLRTSGDVATSVKVAYLFGVQEALSSSRYVYVNPSMGHTWSLADAWDLSLGASGGVKLYTGKDATRDNLVDLQFDALLPHPVSARFAVTPGVHWAGSHLNGRPTMSAWLSVDATFDL